MNATAEPVLVPLPSPVCDFADAGLGAARDAARAPCPLADLTVREGVLELPGELILHHGGRLSSVRLAWRMAGPANAAVICALGGISAHRRVCGSDEARHGAGESAQREGQRRGSSETRQRESERPGWWSEIAGPDRPLDTHRYRILSFDYLGGSGETTGPRDSEPFPSVSTYDQAELLVRLLNYLGIKAVRAIVGGSYGGMVALAFG